uniref:Uncharacterized protein n=1 Tax=Erpetoichthys calabaricus TaxID=27687 RepID=A0A8C4X3P0_ERPCA
DLHHGTMQPTILSLELLKKILCDTPKSRLFEEFMPLQYTSQKQNGINYWIKVNTSARWSLVHLDVCFLQAASTNRPTCPFW